MRAAVNTPPIREVTRKALDGQQYIDIVTNVAATVEAAFTHGLGRIPIGYVVVSRDKNAVVYDGTTAWTEDLIYLRAAMGSVTCRVLVF